MVHTVSESEKMESNSDLDGWIEVLTWLSNRGMDGWSDRSSHPSGKSAEEGKEDDKKASNNPVPPV